MLLTDMRHHVGDGAPNMFVCRCIKNLLALTIGAQDAGGTQQTQVMAYKGWRQTGARGHIGNANWRVQTREDDPQSARVSHEPEHFGKFNRLIIRD